MRVFICQCSYVCSAFASLRPHSPRGPRQQGRRSSFGRLETYTDIVEHAVVQDSVTTPDVELKLYGQTPQYTDPDRQGRAKDSGVYEVLGGGVTYIYTGPCLTPCAVALKDKNNYGQPHRPGQDPLAHSAERLPFSAADYQARRWNLACRRLRGRSELGLSSD